MSTLNSPVPQLLRRVKRLAVQARQTLAAAQALVRHRLALAAYDRGGRRPWSYGYYAHRDDYFRQAFNDPHLLALLRTGQPLPSHYGYRLDARVVEIPWVLARVAEQNLRLLDAGSSLNSAPVLDSVGLQGQALTIITLAPEVAAYWQRGISYVYGDLRNTLFRDAYFDSVVCISTLEHVGMDNTRYAQQVDSARRGQADDFLRVIQEFRRILKPAGKLYVTVPFGRYEDHGWFQQFDAALVDQVIEAFAPSHVQEAVYRYLPDGWALSDRANAAACEFFDVHTSKYFQPGSPIGYPPDFAAGERAVICLELQK